jgi:hypothetical protein
MSIQTIGPRVGVAIVFLTLVVVVLGVSESRYANPVEFETRAATCLIITTEALRPAFASLGDWIDDCGGSSILLTVDELEPRLPGPGTASAQIAYLERIWGQKGYEAVILGGGESVLPFEGTFAERIYRARVATLEQAWALVNEARSAGSWDPDAMPWTPSIETSELLRPGTRSPLAPAAAAASVRRP